MRNGSLWSLNVVFEKEAAFHLICKDFRPFKILLLRFWKHKYFFFATKVLHWNFDDQLSPPNVHRFYACWDTPSDNSGLWQLRKVSTLLLLLKLPKTVTHSKIMLVYFHRNLIYYKRRFVGKVFGIRILSHTTRTNKWTCNLEVKVLLSVETKLTNLFLPTLFSIKTFSDDLCHLWLTSLQDQEETVITWLGLSVTGRHRALLPAGSRRHRPVPERGSPKHGVSSSLLLCLILTSFLPLPCSLLRRINVRMCHSPWQDRNSDEEVYSLVLFLDLYFKIYLFA